jgi:hypothetical protein
VITSANLHVWKLEVQAAEKLGTKLRVDGSCSKIGPARLSELKWTLPTNMTNF